MNMLVKAAGIRIATTHHHQISRSFTRRIKGRKKSMYENFTEKIAAHCMIDSAVLSLLYRSISVMNVGGGGARPVFTSICI